MSDEKRCRYCSGQLTYEDELQDGVCNRVLCQQKYLCKACGKPMRLAEHPGCLDVLVARIEANPIYRNMGFVVGEIKPSKGADG